MSHITRIRTKITEEKYLLQALIDLGYTPQLGQHNIRGFQGQKAEVDIHVSQPFSYDIGFRKVGDVYEIVADWFGVRKTSQKKFSDQLSQRYAYLVSKAKFEEQGFTLIEETQENGKIRLLLRRMA
jgi:hypothetical protein